MYVMGIGGDLQGGNPCFNPTAAAEGAFPGELP